MGSFFDPGRRSGKRFLQELAATICAERRADWRWDESLKPDFYRLTIADDLRALTFQMDGRTLGDQRSEEFRDFCVEVLRRGLDTFALRADATAASYSLTTAHREQRWR